MWLVVNHTRYAAQRSWVQDKDANKIWLVAVKVTYALLPDGSTRLADEQLPVLLQGDYLAEPYNSSLLCDADLAGIKKNTDIIISGSAWQKNGRPGTSVDIKIVVGPIDKRLRVFGDRVWQRGVAGIGLSSPQPFVSMPIIYERAYGGWDRHGDNPAEHRLENRNPLGTGFAVKAEHLIDRPAPNIEYPDQLISAWKDRPAPAGLLPIECHWSPRRELAGTYDAHWQKNRAPLWAADFDQRYHNAAPRDQQSDGYLLGGEPVQLFNLTPRGYLAFALPRIYPTFETRIGNTRIEHRGKLTTVTIAPDAARLTMVWQSALICNHKIDDLDCTVVREKQLNAIDGGTALRAPSGEVAL